MNPNDFVNKTGKQKFFIYGYAQSGSGSLTFPEDFRFVGIVDDEDTAKEIVRTMNEKILEEEGIELEEDEDDEDAREDEMHGALAAADAYQYEYDRLDVITKK